MVRLPFSPPAGVQGLPNAGRKLAGGGVARLPDLLHGRVAQRVPRVITGVLGPGAVASRQPFAIGPQSPPSSSYRPPHAGDPETVRSDWP